MHPSVPRLRLAAALLGLALGGFLDGILFHQVLQWHHLLSGLDRPGLQDPRVQVLADGVFHLLMYALAAAGLWLLWRARAPFGGPGGGPLAWGWMVLGFGAWHVLDVGLFHWILRLHRTRMDVAEPLPYDLAVLAVGLAALAAGAWLLRHPPAPGGRGARGLLSAAVLAAGAGALAPAPGAGDTLLVLFAPGTPPVQAANALAALDARTAWVDRSGTLWAVRLDAPQRARALYAQGAWLVGGGWAAGCLGAARPAPAGR